MSILVISFNHSKFIEKCINSLLIQDFPYSFEIVLSDDASSDDTVDIINELLKSHPRKEIVQCFFQKNNLGIRANIEFALKRCKGKYIAICEGDDFWIRKDKLSIQFSELEANPNLSAVFTDVQIVDDNGCLLKNYYGRPNNDVLYTNDLIWRHYIPTCTYFFRSEVLKLSAFYNFPIINDRFIEIASTLLGPVKFIDCVTAVHIKHPAGASVNKYSRSKRFQHNYSLFESLKSLFHINKGKYLKFNFKLFACSIRLSLHYFKILKLKYALKYAVKCAFIFFESPINFVKGYNAKF